MFFFAAISLLICTGLIRIFVCTCGRSIRGDHSSERSFSYVLGCAGFGVKLARGPDARPHRP